MKSKEEIERLAFLEYPRLINDPYNPMEDDNTYERKIWIGAYTQCQEDMADKKYTEEDMLKAIIYGSSLTPSHAKLYANNYIKSLNKQD